MGLATSAEGNQQAPPFWVGNPLETDGITGQKADKEVGGRVKHGK